MGRILAGSHDGVYLIKLEGDVRLTLCTAIDRYLNAMFAAPNFASVVVDLSAAEAIDSTTLGLLAKLSIEAKKRFGAVPAMFCDQPNLLRVLRSMGFGDVFKISPQAPQTQTDLDELPVLQCNERQAREQVLAAHKTLMQLNDSNRLAFRDLVAALENDGQDQLPPAQPVANSGQATGS